MPSSSIESRGHLAVRCIEKTWAVLRKLHPELPEAVIVLYTAQERRASLGHFAPAVWRLNESTGAPEISVNPFLFGHPEWVLLVLLHEAAHALCYARRIRDCSGRYGEYHLTAFRKAAQELGLQCGFRDGRFGWSEAYFENDRVPAEYAEALKILNSLPMGLQDQVEIDFPEGGKPPHSGHIAMQCACEGKAARRIYLSRHAAERGGILCENCNTPFRHADHHSSELQS